MKSFGSLLAASAALSQEAIAPIFERFMAKYNKTYATHEEKLYRQGVFAMNLDQIDSMNQLEGGATFGVSHFADLTTSEFKKLLGYKKTKYDDLLVDEAVLPEATAPGIDWRGKGVLTPIKNQGQCGSCWAFATTESVESFGKLAGNPLYILSPQQIVSCEENDGCGGGSIYGGLSYVASQGLETAQEYPYTSGHGTSGQCDYNPQQVQESTSGFRRGHGEDGLASALVQGPVAICLSAQAWQYYRGGVMSKLQCGNNPIDHCVQVVGYTPNYWIIRNSWGTYFGMNGFIEVERGVNACQIAIGPFGWPTFSN